MTVVSTLFAGPGTSLLQNPEVAGPVGGVVLVAAAGVLFWIFKS